MSSMGDPLMFKTLAADPTCVCREGFGEVLSVASKPVALGPAAAAGVLPGMTHEETAILAGVLTGLATFLFLALPILCCLCPWPCCGGAAAAAKKKKAMAVSAVSGNRSGGKHTSGGFVRKSDEVSVRSWEQNWDKGDKKFDYENLYEVDMKLPRAWVDSHGEDTLDGRMKGDQWEGKDVRMGGGDQLETYAGNDTVDRLGSYERSNRAYEQASTLDNSGNYGGGDYGTARSFSSRAGQGEIVEYETTRTLHIETAAQQLPEQEYIYEKELHQELSGAGADKDNFSRMYSTYKSSSKDDKQTSF